VDRSSSLTPALNVCRGGSGVVVDAIYSPAHTDGYFPSINIPVVSVIWQYTGLSAKEIEQRMVYTDERALSTTVNNIEHIEPPGDCHSSRRRTGDIFFEAGMARTLEAALP